MSAILIILLVLLNTSAVNKIYAQADAYKDLEKWLADNISVLGLTLWRGPLYDTIGTHIDPVVKLQIKDYSTKKIEYLTMNYTDFIKDYVLMNKYMLKLNITYLGYERTGPITAEWPPFSFIYEKQDPMIYAWGAYPISNAPQTSWYSNEAAPDTINYFNFSIASSIFSQDPQYLYSYLKLDNSSKVTLPKGENIILALSPYNDPASVYSLLKSILKTNNKMIYPSDLSRILNEFPPDDLTSSLITIKWEVIGNGGYLKPVIAYNYTHSQPCGLSFLAYVDGLLYNSKNQSREEWFSKTKDYVIKKLENLPMNVKFCSTSTKILAPSGSPTQSISTIIDLSNEDATNLFISSSVFYIINPNAFDGKDTIKLTISDARERIKLTYYFTIEIGPERFSINTTLYDIQRNDEEIWPQLTNYGYTKTTSQEMIVNSLDIKKVNNYDEDGSLTLKVSLENNYNYIATAHSEWYNPYDLDWNRFLHTENWYLNRFTSEKGNGEIKIGGWIPNPPPPGFIFEISKGNIHTSRIETYTNKDEYFHSHLENQFSKMLDRMSFFANNDTPADGRGLVPVGDALDELWRIINQEDSALNALGSPMATYKDDEYFIDFDSKQYSGDSKSGFLYLLNNKARILSEIDSEVYHNSFRLDQKYTIKSELIYDSIRKTSSYPANGTDGRTYYIYYVVHAYAYKNLNVLVDGYSTPTFSFSETYKDHYNIDTTYRLTEGQPTYSSESKQLSMFLDKNKAFIGENITGYLHSYGKNAEGSTVFLSGYAEFNSTIKIPIKFSSNKVIIRNDGTAEFTVMLPSLSDIKSKTGNVIPLKLPVYIYASDSRGVNASSFLMLYVSGQYIVFDFRDIDIPVPDDPSKSNVLKNLMNVIPFDERIDKQLRLPDEWYLEVNINEKGTHYNAKSLDLRPGDQTYLIFDLKELNLTAEKIYTINYTLTISLESILGVNVKQPYFMFRVRDVGVDLKISNQSDGVIYTKIKIYVPCSLFVRYLTFAKILAGRDERFKMLLSDQAIPFEAIKEISRLFTGYSYNDASPGEISDKSAVDLLTRISNYIDNTMLYIGPKVMFPILGDDANGTELEIFSQTFNFRNFAYNLTPYSLLNPSNYWSKLAKLIILQAEMLRTYQYAEYTTLMLSKMIALIAVLEEFKGFLGYTKLWNKQNIFAIMSQKYPGKIVPTPQSWNTILGSIKIGLLTAEGDILNILGLLHSKLLSNLADSFGSKRAASVVIATTFKAIRFIFTILMSRSEFLSELQFEILFQALATIIAHFLMWLFNASMQLLVLFELEKKIMVGEASDVVFLLQFLTLQFKEDPSYSELVNPLRIKIHGININKPTWAERDEKDGALRLYLYSGDEEVFFTAADFYRNYVEPIISVILSTLRGVDGIKQKITKESFKTSDAILNLLNIPLTYTIPTKGGPKTVSSRLSEVVAKAYIAFVALVLTDGLMKVLWNYAFYNLVIYGGAMAHFISSLVPLLQATAPALVAFLGLRVPIKYNANPINLVNIISANSAIKLQNIAVFSDKDAIGIKEAANRIDSLRSSLIDMLQQSSFDINTLNELANALNYADLILLRNNFRVTDYNLVTNIISIRDNFTLTLSELSMELSFIMNYPSIRPLPSTISFINDRIRIITDILNKAADIINNASLNGQILDKLGPAIVVRSTDISEILYPYTKEIKVTINNVGDEDANVKIALLETDILNGANSGIVTVKAGGSYEVVLSPTMKQNTNLEETIASLSVFANDVFLYDLQIVIPLKSKIFTSSYNGIEVASDGPVSIEGSKIKIINSSYLQILIPKNIAQPRFVALLDNKLIRSGEIRAKDITILGIAFRSQVSGTIEYKSIKQQVEYLQGQGYVKSQTGVSIESNDAFSAQVAILDENPFPEASLNNAEKIKVIAIDLLSAKAGYVTIKINYEQLGITQVSKLSLYKYNATKEAYQEFKDYKIDENAKVIIFTLKPGDPIFALTEGKISSSSSSTQSKPLTSSSSQLMPFEPAMTQLVLYLVVTILAITILAIVLYKRKRKS